MKGYLNNHLMLEAACLPKPKQHGKKKKKKKTNNQEKKNIKKQLMLGAA